MNRSYKFFAILAVLALSALACRFDLGEIGIDTIRGSGEIVTEERDVSGFSRIDMAAVGKLVIEVGEEESLTIEAEDNLIEYFTTEVREQSLVIEIEPDATIIPTGPINFYLTVVQLEGISVSGAGDVDAPDLEANRFFVNISGAGDVNIDDLSVNELRVGISGAGDVDVDTLEGERLDVDISGVGDLEIEDGEVDFQEISISGVGSYRGRNLASAEAEASLSGLGSATIWVTEALDAQISGGGSIRYRGNPSIQESVSGLGNVEKIGD